MISQVTRKQELLGSYLMSLPRKIQAVSGSRVKAICIFLGSPYEISKAGWRDYLKENRAFISDTDKQYILDFLYFHGVRIGQIRKDKTRVVERLDKITEINKRNISEFIVWVEKQREYSSASIRMKSDNMKKFFRYFTEFNNDNCRNFIKTMEAEGMSPKTLNIYMLTLKQYGEYLKKPVALKKISIQRSLSVEDVPTPSEYRSFVGWLWKNEKWQVYWIVRVLGNGAYYNCIPERDGYPIFDSFEEAVSDAIDKAVAIFAPEEVEEVELPVLSEEDYKILCEESEQMDVYDGRGTYDLYVCDDCSHQVITTYSVKGVTPFVIKCPECGSAMKHISTYKSVRPETKVLKWIRPTYNQYLNYLRTPVSILKMAV